MLKTHMWRYLKAAFLVGVEVPGIGRLPLNVLAVAATAIFGAVEPSVWLAGGGLEVALLASLAFSPRFQKLTDGQLSLSAHAGGATQRARETQALVASLPPTLAARLTSLRGGAARVLAIYGSLGFDAGTRQTTEASLDRLQWIFLKLLVVKNHLENELGRQTLPELQARIAQLAAGSGATQPIDAAAGATGIDAAGADAGLARSREATLDILRKRADNLRSRDRLLAENASDLERIEQQVELMRENAAIHGKPYAVDMEIDLASDLATPDLFGAQGSLVESVDRGRG